MGIKLNILGSTSSGNCYVLQSEEEALIIEAGIHPDFVKRALDFNVGKVKGCFISHSHGDHSMYAKLYERYFTVFANNDVIKARELKMAHEVHALKGVVAGGFRVLPFEAFHDVPCLGYFINHADMGNLLFLTDSFMLKNVFNDVNHFLIECNYSDEALYYAIKRGATHPVMRDRLMTTHMELNTTGKVLMDHDLSKTYNIVLIHLSSANSDEEQFKRYLSGITGLPVIAAKGGMELTLKNKPF